MSFASYDFIFYFMPLALAFIWLSTWINPKRLFIPAILISSLVFYGLGSLPHLVLLISLVIISWALSWIAYAQKTKRAKGTIIAIGVIINLCALLVWKYGDSLTALWNAMGWIEFEPAGLLMPLGISFYIIQQCGYLLDLYKDRAKPTSLLRYAAFLTFFPQLLAGPIVTHRRMEKEFEKLGSGISLDERLSMAIMGMGWFSIGLFKKTIIADGLGRIVTPHFSRLVTGDISFEQAWQIALSSPTRIYFDFCGYSEMAVGLGLLCGIKLPANFNAPYRATTLRQYWARWHITFHHFIRDHIFAYFKRKFAKRRWGLPLALFIAISLSTLWHGTSLQFLIWGVFIFLSMYVTRGLFSILPEKLQPIMLSLIALAFFLFMGVLFIAPNLQSALQIYDAMLSAPQAFNLDPKAIAQWVFIIGIFIYARGELSTQNLLERPKMAAERDVYGLRFPNYAPNIFWIAFFALLLVLGIYGAGLSVPFVYFQF